MSTAGLLVQHAAYKSLVMRRIHTDVRGSPSETKSGCPFPPALASENMIHLTATLVDADSVLAAR